ncbi:hypothetical protein [Paraburkholderia azotifigens]|uniref:Uncharacterized protein n=1 Tax=Paraburkholderia azotifigens TaxID=2057004 RepID=A0A5C6V5T4_9BURK|nr:hypothetical protein [Paraburkholderia azotifigens]TXC79921.1 hypothetical protein FRZ40_37005 [Paraburkholderia azotifigens]
MNPIHSRPAAGPSATQETAQTQRGQVEPAKQHTRARFASTLRNNVRFAHAHHAHLQGQARSANARRLAKALAKKRQGKAAAMRFAATRRPATARPSNTARSAQNARNADRQRNAPLRVTRDGGNGGSKGGGQQQQGGQQQEQRQRRHDARDDDFTLAGADDAARAVAALPMFAGSPALTLQGASRREALARAWCDALLKPDRPLHGAMNQLRTLRRHEGALPLASLAQVRQSLMDATARAADRAVQTSPEPEAVAAHDPPRASTAKATRNVLAPLLALVAGAPILAAREGRAASANAALHGIAHARSTRAAQACALPSEPDS